jgi:hypothetical protein
MIEERRTVLLKEYELCDQFILSSFARYFQVQALVLTVVWGGFVLFVTQTEPGSVDSILVTCVAAMGAGAFSLYWWVFATRARFQEEIVWHHAREIEDCLGMERQTMLWLLQRWDQPEAQRPLKCLPKHRRERYSQLATQFKRPWGLTRLPLGRFMGAAGIVAWVWLAARSFIVHFGWL